EPYPPGENRAEFVHVSNGRASRYQWKRNGSNCHPEKPQRQLHQAKRNVQPTDRTVTKARRKSAVDKDVDLHGAGGDHGRPHECEHSAHAFVAPSKIGVVLIADTPKRRELSSQLPGSADQRSNRQSHERPRTKMRIQPPTNC